MEEKKQKKTMEKTVKEKIVATPETKKTSNRLIAVIRIAGQVKVKTEIKNTLDRLRLRRKYVCVLINSSNESVYGMLNKVRFSVAFGDIGKETLIKLLNARAHSVEKKKINAEEVADGLMNGKSLEDFGIKPFFRLHPPRKGIKSKIHYNVGGVLGDNKADINKLIERML
ncbi:50S ribosomal protein L30 [uncultured archaeon]|nr:50S ribosomal protein L30 [uncultured archaeon]